MQGPDYKKKYLGLRSKYINDLDMAFRLGFEQGVQMAQQQQTLDAQAQVNEQQAQFAQPDNSSPGVSSGDQSDQAPETQAQGNSGAADQRGSELDQHIGQLESMLGSNTSPEVQKSLSAILSLRKAEKLEMELKKSQSAISGIAKALHKPSFKIGAQALHNMDLNAQKSVSLQHKIVNDVMKSWATQESKAKNSLESILSVEGLLKE